DKAKIILAPGNHDIARSLVNPVLQEGLRSKLNSRDAINRFIDETISKPKDHFYFERLSNYYRFARQYGPQPVESNPFYSAYRIPLGTELDLGVAVLNTAWMATGAAEDADNGKLLMGERAVTMALEAIRDSKIKVAAYHHPLRYLQEFDASDCGLVLRRE